MLSHFAWPSSRKQCTITHINYYTCIIIRIACVDAAHFSYIVHQWSIFNIEYLQFRHVIVFIVGTIHNITQANNTAHISHADGEYEHDVNEKGKMHMAMDSDTRRW